MKVSNLHSAIIHISKILKNVWKQKTVRRCPDASCVYSCLPKPATADSGLPPEVGAALSERYAYIQPHRRLFSWPSVRLCSDVGRGFFEREFLSPDWVGEPEIFVSLRCKLDEFGMHPEHSDVYQPSRTGRRAPRSRWFAERQMRADAKKCSLTDSLTVLRCGGFLYTAVFGAIPFSGRLG